MIINSFCVFDIENFIIPIHMISIFRQLLIIGALNVAIGRVRMRISCSWPGHGVGDFCATDDDCDGDLTCINGKCGGGNDTCTPCGYLPGHE